MSTVSYKGSADNVEGTYSADYKVGGEAGLAAEIRWTHFAVQPSILYSQRRYKLTDDHVENHGVILHYVSQSDYRFNYLTLPINLAYSLREDAQGIQGFAGGYVSCLLGGQVKGNGYFDVTNVPSIPRSSYTIDQPIEANNEFDRTTNTFYSKRYDYGFQAGIGYRYNRLLAQAAFSVGLANLGASYTGNVSNPSYYNRTAQVYVVYNLLPSK